MSSDRLCPPLTCVSCESVIVGRAEFYAGLPFCCGGCVVGGPCTCSYDPEPADAVGGPAAIAAERESVLV